MAGMDLKAEPAEPSKAALKVGLTGGIGCGKSTVAAMLVALGAQLIDTDAIAHQLTAPQGLAMGEIERAFGAQMLTPEGALDRARMRALAFTDAQALGRLQAILHPLIIQEALSRADRSRREHPGAVQVFDVPLLVGINGQVSPVWRHQVDRVLVVDASEQTQISRVQQRSGWTEEAVRRVMAQQASREARLAAADDVLDNNDGDIEDLRRRVGALWLAWQGSREPSGTGGMQVSGR